MPSIRCEHECFARGGLHKLARSVYREHVGAELREELRAHRGRPAAKLEYADGVKKRAQELSLPRSGRGTRLSRAETWIQHIAERVTKQVEPEDRQADREPREDRQVRRSSNILLGAPTQHRAP